MTISRAEVITSVMLSTGLSAEVALAVIAIF